MPPPYIGGCQCGAVRYRVTAEPLTVYACYCRECQKQTASAFALSMLVPRRDFTVTAGETRTWSRTAESGREVVGHFCASCGVRLYHEPAAAPDLVTLKPGSLDDPTWVRPVANVWTDRASPWLWLDPDLAAFARQPDSFEPLVARYRERASGR